MHIFHTFPGYPLAFLHVASAFVELGEGKLLVLPNGDGLTETLPLLDAPWFFLPKPHVSHSVQC